MSSTLNSTSSSSNSPGSFAQTRIVQVEKHFGILCSAFSSFVRKNARLRDKGDLLAQNIKAYAENETFNTTTRSTLMAIAANFSAVQDYKQAQIIRLEDKVVKPLSDYGTKCRQMKNVIKNQQTKRTKHIKEQNRLEKIRQKSASSTDNRLTQAETDEMRAAQDVAHSTVDLEQKIDGFEKEKIIDLKNVLSNFIQIQMVYHAKALEMYSKCFENLTLLNEYKDLENFRVVLKESSGVPKLNLGNSMVLGSTGQSLTFPSGTYMTPRSTMSSERTVRINPNHTNMYGYEYDDDDDDDDGYGDDLDDYSHRR